MAIAASLALPEEGQARGMRPELTETSPQLNEQEVPAFRCVLEKSSLSGTEVIRLSQPA